MDLIRIRDTTTGAHFTAGRAYLAAHPDRFEEVKGHTPVDLRGVPLPDKTRPAQPAPDAPGPEPTIDPEPPTKTRK